MALVALLVLVVAVVAFAAACGTSTSTGGGSASPAAAGSPVPGGTFKVGMQPGNGQYDPLLMAGSVGDIILVEQVQEPLVQLNQSFGLDPTLATAWSTPDGGKTWKVTLRDGVKFSNGQPMTSADVVYSVDRMRSKKLGSPMADTFAGVKSVVADDPTHVTFNLSAPSSEFMAFLSDYRAKILCKTVKNPMKNLVGTGAFMLKSYAAADRAVLVKNPSYWGKDAAGNSLPYFDEVDFVYSPDTAGQIAGLQGGSLNFVGGISSAQKQTVDSSPGTKTITTPSNYMNEIQIRCDKGPGAKLAFRQALMAGTDLKSLVAIADPGVAEPGNGTIVGPAYKADYQSTTIPFDVTKAKQLLGQAGYPNGTSIKLVVQTADPMPALATAWQAQMKQIGVNVSIQQVPPDVYYADKGTDNWYQAPFGIVDWGTRAVPLVYFQLALTSNAPWNYSRWKNAQFDQLVKQIPMETDATKRGDLYKQAQTILQNEVPMINLAVLLGVAGESKNVEGISLNPDWAHTVFRAGYFSKQ